MPKKGGKKKNSPQTNPPKAEKETAAQQLARLRELVGPRRKAESWLYLAVGTLTIIIAIFWGFSIYSKLTFFELKKSAESKILNENKKTWNELFEAVDTKNSTSEIRANLQTILSELKKASEVKTTSTTPTTTLEIILSTTTNN